MKTKTHSAEKKPGLRFLPYGFILLQSALYGFGDPISKAAYEVVPLYSLLSARYLIALAFLVLFSTNASGQGFGPAP